MKINNFFSEAYYINVDERIDRKKQIELELIKNKLNNFVQRFNAIKPNIKSPENCVKASGASHRSIIQTAKNKNLKNVLILEDDVEWLNFEDGYKKLEELIQLQWNVILLVGWYVTYDFPRIFGSRNAGGYLVNSSYYDILLSNREASLSRMKKPDFGFITSKKKYASDHGWGELQRIHIWYGIHPCMCRQVDGYSDHCNRAIEASLIHGIATPEVAKRVYNIII
jgi:hypothetical protein